MAWINQQAGMTRALPLPRRERPHTSLIRTLAEGKEMKEGKPPASRASPKKQNTGARPVF